MSELYQNLSKFSYRAYQFEITKTFKKKLIDFFQNQINFCFRILIYKFLYSNFTNFYLGF